MQIGDQPGERGRVATGRQFVGAIPDRHAVRAPIGEHDEKARAEQPGEPRGDRGRAIVARAVAGEKHDDVVDSGRVGG